MSVGPILVDSLTTHARGRTLALTLGARSGELPPSGVVLCIAKEFQESARRAHELLTWTDRPGRLLVLVPPFARIPSTLPVEWEARRTESLAGGTTRLGAVLARERQHELRGALISMERGGGQTVTGGWRRHPAAGLLVVTTLPLWSLITLDHRTALQQWLDALQDSAGQPLAAEECPPETTPLTGSEWAMLLHLCRGPFEDRAAAICAFAELGIQRIEDDPEATLRSLERRGLCEGGQLTPGGAEILDQSPYSLYAHELKRSAHG